MSWVAFRSNISSRRIRKTRHRLALPADYIHNAGDEFEELETDVEPDLHAAQDGFG